MYVVWRCHHHDHCFYCNFCLCRGLNKMFVDSICDKTIYDLVTVRCDNLNCNKEFIVLLITANRNFKRNNNLHVCRSCISKKYTLNKPQCTPSFWSDKKKIEHGKKVKKSNKYQVAIKNRKSDGVNNPMFGKSHSLKTLNKMSNSRKGKFGLLSTAWKGGKSSLTKRVKQYVYKTTNWTTKILNKYNRKCVECKTSKKLDIHHIEPVSKIIKRLCRDLIFTDENEKFNFLITQKDIVDNENINGIVLCRTCHKQIHLNWGSHTPLIKGIKND